MIKQIPNTITCLNLISGCVGIVLVFKGEFFWASHCIYAGLIFDFLDGFMARILKVSSPIGKELDSLSDMITFGVLPAAIFFSVMQQQQYSSSWWSYGAVVIAVFSAIRLARFNVDERQTSSFIGVPTPTNAMFISALPFIAEKNIFPSFFAQPVLMLALAILLSWLLVSGIPLFALKFKSFGWAENKFKYILLMISLVLLLSFSYLAIPLIIACYIILSIIENKFAG